MSVFEPGLVHTPVTPFTRDNHIDYDTFAKLIEFHLRSGADSLALPMHIGESVSLTDEEQRALLAFAIKQVNGRKPIIAHIAGTEHRVSAAAIGATGLFSPLAGVAPKLIRKLYDSCRKDQLVEARGAQEAVAALRQHLKSSGSLKGAMRTMGRDCGVPRPPLQAPDAEA